MRASDQSGSLHVAMLLVLLLLGLTGFGVWGLLHQWRTIVTVQLRLDRCVGVAALEFRDRMNRIERINGEIKLLRAAVAAAALRPELIPALKTALKAEVLRQDAEITGWSIQQLRWIARQGCLEKMDWGAPLPSMHWVRPIEDPLGPLPLHWPGQPDRFQIQVLCRFKAGFSWTLRISAARVTRSTKDVRHAYKTAWAAPLAQLLWTNHD